MEQTETSATDTKERTERNTELVRPLEGRMLAGVAQGIANNFGISEWIPRVFFIVTAFMGGLGVALYAAGWAFIRSEDEATSPAERFFSGNADSRSWIGLGLIVLAGVIVLSNFTFLAGEVVWAGLLLVVGLLLYLGYIPGWPSRSNANGDTTSNDVAESKEGVQQMTSTTDTVELDTETKPSGDSPAGGATPPPVPAPSPPPSPPAPPRERSILGRLTMGAIAIGLGVLAILDNVGALAANIEPYHYLALGVTILGIGLIVGGFVGRARWLIIVGAITVPTLIFSPFFGYDFEETNFNLEANPTTFATLDEEYHVSLGNLEIDLTDLPWTGEDIVLDASVDIGNLDIRLPDGVGIVGNATVDIGRVSEPGRATSGLGERGLVWNEPGDLGTVLLDAEVNIGNIDVRR